MQEIRNEQPTIPEPERRSTENSYPSNNTAFDVARAAMQSIERNPLSKANETVKELFDAHNSFFVADGKKSQESAAEGNSVTKETPQNGARSEDQASGKQPSDQRNSANSISDGKAQPNQERIQKTTSGEEIHATKVEVDKDGKVRSVKMSDGAVTTYQYKDNELVGKVTAKDGKVQSIESGDGSNERLQYDSDGKLTSRVTTDKSGKVTAEIKPDGDSSLCLKNKDGDLHAKARIDKDGKLLSWKNVQTGETTQFRYNEKGEPTERVTTDKSGKLTDIISADGTRTHHKYDDDGKLYEKSTYNSDGKIKSTESAYGDKRTFDYDADGKFERTNYFNSDGQLVRKFGKDGSQTSYTHDATGKVVHEMTTDKSGKITDEKKEQLSPEREKELRAELEKSAARNSPTVASGQIHHSGNLNQMWEIAKKLPGDSQKTMVDALNAALPKASKFSVSATNPEKPNAFLKRAIADTEIQLHIQSNTTGQQTGAWIGMKNRHN